MKGKRNRHLARHQSRSRAVKLESPGLVQAPDLFGPSVASIYADYVSFLQRAGKASADNARYCWRVLQLHFGNRSVREINDDLSISYVKARRADGVRDSSAWAELSKLQAAIAHAQRNGKIPAMPAFWKPAPPRRRERWLSRDEARRLIQAADRAPHVKLFCILALATAARESSLLELRWSQVDLENGWIDFDDPDRPRTNKRRATVAINAMAREALLEAKARGRSRWVIEYGGRRLRCVWAGVAAAAKRAGLEGVSPHTLRHTAGTWAAHAGVQLIDVANMMGIAVATAAAVYLKRTPNHLVDAAAAVNLEGLAHAQHA